MKTTSFIAESAADALAQVRHRLGASAVVLETRPLVGAGLLKFWRKPRLEVLAGVPEAEPIERTPMLDLLQQISQLNRQLPPLSKQDQAAVESLLAEVPDNASAASQASVPSERSATDQV